MDFVVKKGFDIGLEGKPSEELGSAPDVSEVAVYPLEFEGVRQRLKVGEGDTVKAGSELIENKKNKNFKICAPASGAVKKITRGERRFVEKIVIELDGRPAEQLFDACPADRIRDLSRDDILGRLLSTGYLSYIRQRPFGGIADVEVVPKSIFVNAMNTAPFQADAGVVTGAEPEAFQAGLDILGQLTEGDVHLCTDAGAKAILKNAKNVTIHTFGGPHPAGNTSVHISRVDPMLPADIVWTVRAVDLVWIGRLFLDGRLPESRIVAHGGPGFRPEARKHIRVRTGACLGELLPGFIDVDKPRIINGDVLSGTVMESDNPGLRFHQSAINVLQEGRERLFLGWMEPGFNQFSFTRLCASTFFGRHRTWAHTTNRHGGERAMVLTGHYDRVMPMNIMVDYLVRAVLAGDTDEAIKHGILETMPEDYALCEFICPCKMELQEIIRKGLKQIEQEGI